MIEDRQEKQKHRCNAYAKKTLLLFGLMLLLSFTVGGTLAYIATKSNTVQNQFEAVQVSCQVIVEGDKISVKNTSDIDAYLRASIVVNWMDSEGNVYATAPMPTVTDQNGNISEYNDYKLTLMGTGDWELKPDGYYYHVSRVGSGRSKEFISDIKTYTTNKPSGYELSVEVVAEAIQADGDTDDTSIPAYQDAWNITEEFKD